MNKGCIIDAALFLLLMMILPCMLWSSYMMIFQITFAMNGKRTVIYIRGDGKANSIRGRHYTTGFAFAFNVSDTGGIE
jgi:hypothetical protein